MTTSDAYLRVEKKISDTLYLLSVDIDRYREWIPGMYMEVSLEKKSASEPWLDKRAFSIASWGEKSAKILVRKAGSFTSTLISQSMEGFETSIRYPMGRFLINPGHSKVFITSIRYPMGRFLINPGHSKVFIAGGAGISVFLSYIDYLINSKMVEEEINIYHSIKMKGENLESIYWNELPENINVSYFITGKEEKEYTGRMSIKDITETSNFGRYKYMYYICGPTEFNRYWEENLKSIGESYLIEDWRNSGV